MLARAGASGASGRTWPGRASAGRARSGGVRGAVVEAVETLHRRSLIECVETAGGSAFMVQSVVRDYVAERLVEDPADERGNAVNLPKLLGDVRDLNLSGLAMMSG